MSLERMYAYEPEHAAIVTLPLGVKLLTPEYLMDANIDVGTKG